MASVFLSYDRDDDARARPIAKQLELAGHSVWWDRQIKGGGEFSAEIEAALERADSVVVLWSERSVRSAWVRDEAAVGRDTGRLVPATLDGTKAPLGFRQFQTIDLSHWKGRGSSPELEELLNAVATGETTTPPEPTSGKRTGPRLGRPLLLGGAALVMVAAAGALFWQFRPTATGGTPTLAIVAADGSVASKQLASDAAARIAGLDDPSATDFHITDANSATPAGEYQLKVAAGAGNGSRPTLTLVSSRSNTILWSRPLDLAQVSSDDVAQVVAVTAQRALSCAADALSYRRENIDQETLKLYLQGCTRFDDAYGTGASDAANVKAFQDVIAKVPHFVPAWSKLFAVESDVLYSPDRDGIIPTVRAQLGHAAELGLDVPEAYAVKAGLLSPGDFAGILRTYDEGIAKHPDNAFLHRLRGERYSFVGRMNDAVDDTGHAVQLAPLSPGNLQSFASELAYSGDTSAGEEQLRKAEHLWPNAFTVQMARYRYDLRFGDPREAEKLYRKFAVQAANPAQALFLEARINPTPQNIEAALAAERQINRQFPPYIASIVQALAYFGRKDEVIDLLINYPGGKRAEWIGFNAEVLFRPMMHDVWRDPRSMAGAAHVGLLHYWKATGKWPDFCFDPTLPYDCKKEAAKYKV
ncbi:MAG TPA: TIR domain-containing protein [Sphingomicrobium sp.]